MARNMKNGKFKISYRFSETQKHLTEIYDDDDLLTHEELKNIEKVRRALLRKVEDPSWKIVLFNWDGTVLSLILFDPLLWFTMLTYTAVRVWSHYSIPDQVKGMIAGASGNITAVNTFISFFLVFFVVGNTHRFDDQYLLCMTAKGCILDIASLAKACLPRSRGLRIVRYLNASYAAGFVGLSEAYSYDNYFRLVNKNLILLTDQELYRVEQCDMNHGGSCYREIVQWVQREIERSRKKKEIDSLLANQLRDKVLTFQSSMSQLYNFADQPIIFFYIHLLSFVSILYLPLFALFMSYKVEHINKEMSNASNFADVFAGIVVLLQSVFVIGLRILGQKLSDPFGTDFEDLSVMFYVTFTWTQSGRIMSADPPVVDDEDSVLEEVILHERESIGAAWDVFPSSDSTAESVETQKAENGNKPSPLISSKRFS